MKLRHFEITEFACKGGVCCDGSYPMNHEALLLFDDLRETFGSWLAVNSGFRCRLYNEHVGGAEQSWHTRGVAADLRCEKAKREDLLELIYHWPPLKRCGIGLYNKFVHIDCRYLFGHPPAFWDERHGD